MPQPAAMEAGSSAPTQEEALGLRDGGEFGGVENAGDGSPNPGSDSDPTGVVSFEDDHPVSGGSVEGNPGSGWDFCHARFPGIENSPSTAGAASHGESYLTFNSEAECILCTPDGTDSQVMFLLLEPLPATRQGLWFDIRTDEPSPQRGALTFVSVGPLCETQAVLAEADLASLSAGEEWRTRCVTVEPAEPVHDLGVYVEGDRFAFNFDALRAGPPCDTE